MKIWLDDERTPPSDDWVWCKTTGDALVRIMRHSDKITHISFDHDLGTETTGYDVANIIDMLCSTGHYPEDCVLTWAHYPNELQWDVHSANPVGRDKIKAAMKGIGVYNPGFKEK